jgi:hypothetical protein
MNASMLETELADRGIACRVEARERMAIVVLGGELSRARVREWRADAVRLARAHGFTHVALELTPD